MFVSKKKQLLFYHVPKTAGNSIKAFLYEHCEDAQFLTSIFYDIFCKQNPDVKFIESYQHQNLYSTNRKSYLKSITFNHIDNADFFHLNQIESQKLFDEMPNFYVKDFLELVLVRNPYDRLISFYNFTLYQNYDNIDVFLDDIVNNSVDKKYQYFIRSQLDYIKNPLTKNLKIFKHENIKECEAYLQSLLNTDKKLPYWNTSRPRLLELTQKQKDLWYKISEEEFETLGYSK